MQWIENRFVYSASDLNDYLQCKRLTELEALHALGRIRKPARDDQQAELVRRKGEEHEQRHLERLFERHGADNVVRFERAERTLESFRRAEEATLEAMRAGATVIYQATFFDGQFLGRADFLRRIPEPSNLGPWGYEVVDTKLALNPKPYFLVQLCNYSEHLERLQGVAPERGHVVLGDGTEASYRLSDYAAYYRRLKRTFLSFAGDTGRAATEVAREYPIPIEHCKTCDWDEACSKKREDDDHLSGVAWMRRDQISAFEAAGIPTIDALAKAPDDGRPAGMNEATFAKLRRQAALQVRGRQSGRVYYEIVDHAPPTGFALLPPPDSGDVFFDMEGDPLYEIGRGLEYLFGCWMPHDDPPFKAFWGCDRAAEKRAFEDFVDFVVERRRRFPALHVYHYAPYEKTALRRLAQTYGTREQEVDELLRGEVLVDLYAVVRQALVISEDGYGLKQIEKFYPLERATEVKKGDQSNVMFEKWLQHPDDAAILSDIERYNRDDCRSTFLLREWLLERRYEATGALGRELPFRAVQAAGVPCHPEFLEGCKSCDKRQAAEREERRIGDLERRLLAGVLPPQSETEYREMSGRRRAEFLLANLLAYHRREDKPVYWAYFDRRENLDQLLADREALDGLRLRTDLPPEKIKQSNVYTYTFPEQPHKFDPGDAPHDPAKPAYSTTGTILGLDEDRGELRLKWTGSLKEAAAITALLPRHPIPNTEQRKALERIARAFVDGSLEQDLPATYDLLLARDPSVGGKRGAQLQPEIVSAERISALARTLDGSYLFIQGPPGSGKTTKGAHVICDLLQGGKRVGIASTGHKAMHNLLGKVERQMHERGGSFRGLYKHSDANAGSKYESRVPEHFVESTGDAKDFDGFGYHLAIGTSWLFAREQLLGGFDYLFLDEAGQVSLADALAMSGCANNVVLLGDPLQLAQVSQGVHPLHAGDSVLQHLLGDQHTVGTKRGVFLDVSYRMHPETCAFVSEAVYDNRLKPYDPTATHCVTVDGERRCGLEYVPIEHAGNESRSADEADYIVREILRLRRGTVIDSRDDSGRRALRDDDVLVITPYNAQRRLIAAKLAAAGISTAPGGVEVGTVDKFQGREAAVVFYSMATSSGEDAPRDMTFLFEQNRFNVAISRARALSVLVCSPRLLETACSTPEQMALVNLLCAFVERARVGVPAAATG